MSIFWLFFIVVIASLMIYKHNREREILAEYIILLSHAHRYHSFMIEILKKTEVKLTEMFKEGKIKDDSNLTQITNDLLIEQGFDFEVLNIDYGPRLTGNLIWTNPFRSIKEIFKENPRIKKYYDWAEKQNLILT